MTVFCLRFEDMFGIAQTCSGLANSARMHGSSRLHRVAVIMVGRCGAQELSASDCSQRNCRNCCQMEGGAYHAGAEVEVQRQQQLAAQQAIDEAAHFATQHHQVLRPGPLSVCDRARLPCCHHSLCIC